MNKEATYQGSCFCGAVQFTLSGSASGQGYCHCESCRQWSAGPVNAFTLWNPSSIQIIQGKEHIGTFNKTSASYRSWCKVCGGHLFTEHPSMNMIDVYASAIPNFPFEPEVHVHYQETVLHMFDGLPKMKDMPTKAVGSGQHLAE